MNVDVELHIDALVDGEARVVDGFTVDVHVQFDGVVAVEGASEEGHVARAVIEIMRCVNPDTGAVIFEPGTVITVDGYGTGEVTLTPAEGDITAEQLTALLLAFPFRRPGSPTGQIMFGPDGPMRVGESWEIDREFLAESLGDDGYLVGEAQLSGTASLTAVEDCAGAECLVLESHFTAAGASYEREGSDTVLGEGELTGEVRIRAPIDTRTFLRSEEGALTGAFTMMIDTDDGAIERDVRVMRRRSATYTPAP